LFTSSLIEKVKEDILLSEFLTNLFILFKFLNEMSSFKILVSITFIFLSLKLSKSNSSQYQARLETLFKFNFLNLFKVL